MNTADSNPPAALPGSRERKIVLLLCVLAAVHVFIFSGAFPPINNVDEQAHFDLVVKYSHGRVPCGLEPLSRESMQYIVIYGSQEFLWPPETFAGGTFPPPPWTQPLEKIAPVLQAREAAWQSANHESSQPPLYYAVAGLWWYLGQCLGLDGGRLLYWLRFLDILFVAALVRLGHAAAKEIFPENIFLRLGVPALLAFMPQTSFYSINNDVLSPLCFGAAFVCLVKWLRAEIPGARLGILTGLALAATFLAKMSNLPLLAVAFAAVLLKIARLAKSGKLRASIPSLAPLFFSAGLPMAAWLAWCKIHFGDFTGTSAKIRMLTWTLKPFGEWWHHPIFTPHGFWIFISGLMTTFWHGEFFWHGELLASPAVDAIYLAMSGGFFLAALFAVFRRHAAAPEPQRRSLRLAFWSFAAAVAFPGFLSVIYDFHDCVNPSRGHPYFTSGRLILGALIPFMLLFVYGIDRALKKSDGPAKFLALAVIVLFMLVSEIVTDWTVFASQYNWFHM